MNHAFSPIVQEFDDARDADDAVYDLNGKTLCGERYAVFNNLFFDKYLCIYLYYQFNCSCLALHILV